MSKDLKVVLTTMFVTVIAMQEVTDLLIQFTSSLPQ